MGNNKIILDVNTIEGIKTPGGRILTAKEIFEFYKETGILVYNSNAGVIPIVVEGEIKLVDYNSKEGQEFLSNFKTKGL